MPTLPELDIDFGDPLSLPERGSSFQPQSAEVDVGGETLMDLFGEELPDVEDDVYKPSITLGDLLGIKPGETRTISEDLRGMVSVFRELINEIRNAKTQPLW